ncbi:MAG: SRPBCC domain-containing protein [Candidatus Promineifilaceae bacterium]|nr:SRPBCC domain-containing protein [Candidatus Promineifilaceae bacterium]
MSDLSFSETIAVAPEAVYQAFTNEAAVTQWLCNTAHLNVRLGGAVYFCWNQPDYYAAGEFVELEPNERLAFTWRGRGEPAQTTVTVQLTPQNGHTEVSLTHGELGSEPEWHETRQQVSRGWEYSLTNLKQVLEEGRDKRVYDLPFLGIFPGGVLSSEEAAERGLPVEGGVHISGTVPETGAAEVGLREGDILTRLGEIPVRDFSSLREAVLPHKAGAVVKIEYYRDGERQTAEMTLSSRPVPDVPETPTALAEALRQTYAQLDQELHEIVDGISEEVAAHRPYEDEWSAKEILAHVLTTERTLQVFIANVVDGHTLRDWPNNPQPWISGVAEVHTLSELVTAIEQTEAETVHMVADLPPRIVERKASYFGIGTNVLQGFPGHTQSHYGAMQRIVTAAQEAVGTS